MNNVLIALLSAAEFEIARHLISGLSACASYDEWLDRRYGTFMGRSLGGADTGFRTVGLEPFLEWCACHGVRPSELALDAFAVYSAQRGTLSFQAQADNSGRGTSSSSQASSAFVKSKGATSRRPKSASRSAGVDL